ncbi:hypothetical protein EHQ23_17380 [Leptospira bourretii]|uniref:Alginate export domain-containing protein n=1 Tax=Leptospira bourretii TaxID=2484962 RepID=A0A4R9IJM3_9LEPT|nr:hypothetical protein [Leptospira bourretii]TGK79381.1 hypothetical protein EHQ23_17380 [Leptospira bourretii]TGK89587.1 hypothetical protein EHQ26_14230 [Leptospira bourretii]TGL30598.1 hypothetical protein EHQ45_13465 [Leptospira bourretii]
MNSFQKFFLISFFLLFGMSSIQAVGVEVGILGYELFFKEKTQTNQFQSPIWDLQIHPMGKEFQNSSYLNRVSGESMFVGLKDKNKRENVVWDLNIQLTSGIETGLRPFYLGKNHFIAYETSKFLFGVGRREHLFRPKSFGSSYDGGDGFFLEFFPQPNLTLQFFLWDHYSGVLLLEKDRFLSLLQIPSEDLNSYSELRNKDQRTNVSHHRRHSFGLVYGEYLSLRLGIQYVELGSWGKHVKDHTKETKASGADGDSLLNGNVGFRFDAEIWEVQFDFLWAKGNDRTNSKVATQSSSIPIAGEAIQLGSEVRFGGFLIRSSHFISDREERNQKNQIIRDGYVSMGSHPAQTPYLSQIFRIFPSAALTERGYEKNYALKEGRSFGYLNELVLQFTYHQFVLKIIGSYFLPYQVTRPSDGRISFQKRDFEVFYIGEGLLELSLKEDSSFELGIGVSQLFVPDSLGLKSNFGYVFGRLEI